MTEQTYTFTASIQAATIGKGGAYVQFPGDIRAIFGKGRVKVRALFDQQIPYDGSIVNMGLKKPDRNICYILGVRKDIRAQLKKEIGDSITVKIRERL
ncbi:DUF1905 domain-containing protein [Latilactobacillus curvatus]|uniref:DUF1905 domain-containing protein n=1 Tax=Latilactobacillus curvatus TaxID=28038 RepID=UPI00345EF42F